MGSRFFLCSILASSLAWHFPFSSAAAQQITSETLELRGRVINSATGEPVALALVQVSAPGPKTQFTGADGTFVFTGLPPGNYRSEEHTSELQSLTNLVCRLLLEK